MTLISGVQQLREVYEGRGIGLISITSYLVDIVRIEKGRLVYLSREAHYRRTECHMAFALSFPPAEASEEHLVVDLQHTVVACRRQPCLPPLRALSPAVN